MVGRLYCFLDSETHIHTHTRTKTHTHTYTTDHILSYVATENMAFDIFYWKLVWAQSYRFIYSIEGKITGSKHLLILIQNLLTFPKYQLMIFHS